jgi:dolichol-phosphate mannosyltransferase
MRVLAIAPCTNEAGRIGRVVRAMPPDIEQTLVVDDGSRDDTAAEAERAGARVLSHASRRGVGAAIRAGFRLACEEGFDAVVVLAGNTKDDPREIPSLLEPLRAGHAEFVQGSRWLRKDASLGRMPLSRRVATRVHPLLFSAVSRRFVTESTNGFRAISRAVLDALTPELEAPWLDGYQLEPWLYLRVIRLGFRTVEVPVHKVYPATGPMTKMLPVTGWWQMLEPLARAAWWRR